MENDSKCRNGRFGMDTKATILHADLDAFYASVEQLLDPSLRGKPIAVGGGVVLAASYEAKAFGISGGMPGWRARELCPRLIFVDGHFKEYQRLGDAAIKVLNDFTPLVERISIDEAFADVAGCTHLFGPPAGIVARAVARSHGWRQADGIGVESRSAANQDASPGAIGWRPVGARQEACRRASVPTRVAPSCRPGRHPATGELPTRTDRNRPRSFRRPSIGHPLRHTRCTDLSDHDPDRDRRGTRMQGARGPPGRKNHLTASDLRVAPRDLLGFSALASVCARG